MCHKGATRKGSFAAWLPIDHKDIDEFLTIREEGSSIQNISFGVTVPNYWIEEMKAGDVDKRTVWAKVLKRRAEVGFPYIMFSDTSNNSAPDVYKDKGKRILASNLCVTGDQRVVSDRGMLTVEDLYNQGGNLVLFDNDKPVNASSMRLIERDAPVYRVTLSNGMSHKITGYHKLLVRTSCSGKPVTTQMIACDDLKVGDKVAFQTNKGMFGNRHMPNEAFLLGLYQADGTQHDDLIMLDVWEQDFDLLEEVQSKFDYVCNIYGTQYAANNRTYDIPTFRECKTSHSNVRKQRLIGKALSKALKFEKGYIPEWIWQSNEETQWEYIRGLYFADGTVCVGTSSDSPLYLSITNINHSFIQELQLLLANLGINTSIHIQNDAGTAWLPDGKGGYKYYNTKTSYRLITGNKNDALLFNECTGFLDRKNVVLENRTYRDNTKKFRNIVSIEYVGTEDVYCTTVDSNEHLWVCNGFITSNCSEIQLSSDENESFVCDLASMNILHFDEWKDTDAVEVVVMLLDAVMSEFIEKADGLPFMERPVNFAKAQRALGLGWLGWHSYLQSKMIPFESTEAKLHNTIIAKTIQEQAWSASRKLADMFGEPGLLKGYGRRNVTLTAIAPTKSSAFVLGQVSEGIEPVNSNYYIKDLFNIKFTYRNPYLTEGVRLA